MFTTATRKTVIRLFIVAALLAGLGYAVHLGEDGMLGSSEVVSTWIYGISGVVLYYALLIAFLLWRRRRRRG